MHSQRFLIVGFNDANFLQYPSVQLTHFRDEDCYETDHIPSQESLRAYAKERGYFPSRKTGSSLHKCEPLYLTIGEGRDFLKCPICWPVDRSVIDNRIAPGA